MDKVISRWRQQLSQLGKIRGRLESQLMRPKPLGIGSVVKQVMFCGKASCVCHRDPQKKHGPYYYLSYKEGGQSRYKYLGKAASPEVERVLVKHKLIRGRAYILDATDLPTTERYKGCGVKKVVRREWSSKEGKEVEVVKVVYGYKLLVLLEARDKIVVAARVVKINEHEKNFTKEMVREAQHRTGGKVKVLLVNLGFIDGTLLWWLSKKERIKFVIPARSNMEVSQDIRGFRSEKADGERILIEQTKEIKR